jgi:hypothetical protein
MVGEKFYPRVRPLMVLLAVSVGFAVGSFWLWQDAVAIGEILGAPSLGRVLGLVASVGLGVGGIGILLFGLPFLQRYLRRRPSLELREDRLVLTMGLGKVHEFPWEDIAEVRATRLAGRLGLGWVTVHLAAGQRSLGRDISVPHLFLDRDVEEVAEAMQPFIAPSRRRGQARQGGIRRHQE